MGASRRAACLGVVVGETHALRGQLITVRSFAGHHALMIRANVKPTHVIAHDEQNVGLLLSSCGLCGVGRRARQQETGDGKRSQRGFSNTCPTIHNFLLYEYPWLFPPERREYPHSLVSGKVLCESR